MRPARSLVVVAVLGLIATACTGPRVPLEVGIKEFPSDVILGTQIEPPPPRQSASNPVPVGVGFAGAPAPTGPVMLPPGGGTPEVACPDSDPLEAPKLEARNRATKAPVEGSYLFRNKGEFATADGSGSYPPTSVRTVKDVSVDEDGTFAFNVVEDLAGTITTTRYDVVPEGGLPPDGAGIFLVAQQTRLQDGSSDDFNPTSPLKIMTFPAQANAAWDSTATDPLSGQTWAIHGRIGIEKPDGPDPDDLPDIQAKARINACGEPIDAWYVEISGPGGQETGTITRPDGTLNIKALFAISTQFGGLLVFDSTEITGTQDGSSVDISRQTTINEVPKSP